MKAFRIEEDRYFSEKKDVHSRFKEAEEKGLVKNVEYKVTKDGKRYVTYVPNGSWEESPLTKIMEKTYSTGDETLDELLEKAFCDGYYLAQKEYFDKKKYLAYPLAALTGIGVTGGIVSGCASSKDVAKPKVETVAQQREDPFASDFFKSDETLGERMKSDWDKQFGTPHRTKKKVQPQVVDHEENLTDIAKKYIERQRKDSVHKAHALEKIEHRQANANRLDSIQDARRDARYAKAAQRDSIQDARRDARYAKAIQKDSIGGTARYEKALHRDSIMDAKQAARRIAALKRDSIQDVKRDARFNKAVQKVTNPAAAKKSK